MNLLNKKKFILIVALLILVISSVFYFKKSQSTSTRVGFGKATQEDLIQRVTFAGVVVPARKTIIAAPYNGYIRKIFVKVGDHVKVDDPIVNITQSLQSTETNFPLRAPFAGIVVQSMKSEGEFVKEGDLKDFIVRIDDLQHLKVYSNAPEIDRNKIQMNQEAIIKATAILNKSYKGIIKTLSLSAREKEEWSRSQTVEFPIAIEITNPDSDLRPGMSVLIDIITQKKEKVLTLRHEFIHKENDKYYVITQDGTKKTIKVGLQNDEVFEILEGITTEDFIKQVDFSDLNSPSAEK